MKMDKSKLQKIGAKIPRDKLALCRVPWWIDPEGAAVRLPEPGHAASAIEMLRKRGIEAGPDKAVGAMIGEGWIRVQVYPDDTAFIQGTFESILKRGRTILKIVPNLKSVELSFVPAGDDAPPTLGAEEINRTGWEESVRRARLAGS
ncbi:MAG: hypothetical protein A3G34_08740 [Candidatus Lindowbacteria bacterium RIFCSPLOWO2_12_FULL_62_27]|nr:MAG: hypothetical protein A3G34_08740 [Candidatus Lindowbacteria bacterium RIFCSPLOWO2_12_FULL_62_27]